MGEYLSGAIGKCTPMNSENALETKRRAICAQYSMKLVQQLSNVDRASVQMSKDCELSHDQRLYLEQEDDEEPTEEGSSLTLGLAALLPISTAVAFAAGSRFAKVRVQTEQDT